MANLRFWGEAPQREYTARRLCPGPVGSEPHISRWWRWIDTDRRDGWHCCACTFTAPERSPIDGELTERAVTALPPRGEQPVVLPLVRETLAIAA